MISVKKNNTIIMQPSSLFSSRPARLFRALTFIFLLCCSLLTRAQDIDFTTCPNPPHNFTGVAAGNPIAPNIVINAINGAGTPAMSILYVAYETSGGGFEFSECDGDCTASENLFGVTIAASGATVTVSGTPAADKAGNTIIFTVRATANGVDCDRTYRLPIMRKPLDLSLVLDLSGSMSEGYNGSWPAPAGQRRWDGLITGVGILSAHLATLSEAEDKISVRMFGSTVTAPPAPFNGALVPTGANINQLPGLLGAIMPSGVTALGDGIMQGNQQILPGTAGSNKAMIVFTDGMQNAGDEVKTAMGAGQYTHTNANQKLSGPGNEIRIYTICLGSSGHNPMLMEGIANANGGKYMNTPTGQNSDFTAFFTAHINNILAGSSPQFIDVRKGAMAPSDFSSEFPAPPTTTQEFSINKGSNKVIITFEIPSGLKPTFTSVRKDSLELIQYGMQRSGPGYITIAFRTPFTGIPSAALNGKWKVTVSLGGPSRVAVPFTFMAVADDHVLDPVYSLNAKSFKVNNVLKPSVRLTTGKRSVQGAKIQAIILKPGDDVNDLIARAKVDMKQTEGDPASPDVAKLNVLLQDSAFLNKIRAKDQLLDLTYNAADSTYGGSFNGLDVTGVYQIIYHVSADDSELGRIERFHQESFYVRFAEIDLPNSNMSVTVNGGFTTIVITPQAKNGRLIGPGWADAITLEAAGGATIDSLRDKGDGTYEIVIKGDLSGPVKLSIGGETVIDGKIGSLNCYSPNANIIQKIQCWLISIGLPAWMLWVILLLILLIILLAMRKKKK